MPKRGENIYKRKDGRWEGRFKKSTGYGYVYGKTYSEVKKMLVRKRLNLTEQEKQSVQKTLKFICESWLVAVKLTVKQSTYDKYKTSVENHILAHFKNIRADEISPDMIEEFTVKLLMRERLSAGTVRGILRLLKAILAFAKDRFNACPEIPKITYPKETPKEMAVFEKQEQIKLEKALASDMDLCRLGVLLSLYTGLRIGELCALFLNIFWYFAVFVFKIRNAISNKMQQHPVHRAVIISCYIVKSF